MWTNPWELAEPKRQWSVWRYVAGSVSISYVTGAQKIVTVQAVCHSERPYREDILKGGRIKRLASFQAGGRGGIDSTSDNTIGQ